MLQDQPTSRGRGMTEVAWESPDLGNGNGSVAGVSGSDLRKVSHGGQGCFSSFVLLPHFTPYPFCLSIAASQSTFIGSQGRDI